MGFVTMAHLHSGSPQEPTKQECFNYAPKESFEPQQQSSCSSADAFSQRPPPIPSFRRLQSFVGRDEGFTLFQPCCPSPTDNSYDISSPRQMDLSFDIGSPKATDLLDPVREPSIASDDFIVQMLEFSDLSSTAGGCSLNPFPVAPQLRLERSNSQQLQPPFLLPPLATDKEEITLQPAPLTMSERKWQAELENQANAMMMDVDEASVLGQSDVESDVTSAMEGSEPESPLLDPSLIPHRGLLTHPTPDHLDTFSDTEYDTLHDSVSPRHVDVAAPTTTATTELHSTRHKAVQQEEEEEQPEDSQSEEEDEVVKEKDSAEEEEQEMEEMDSEDEEDSDELPYRSTQTAFSTHRQHTPRSTHTSRSSTPILQLLHLPPINPSEPTVSSLWQQFSDALAQNTLPSFVDRNKRFASSSLKELAQQGKVDPSRPDWSLVFRHYIRRRQVQRFLEKKRQRQLRPPSATEAKKAKSIKYECRKKFADARPREHGRFVKSDGMETQDVRRISTQGKRKRVAEAGEYVSTGSKRPRVDVSADKQDARAKYSLSLSPAASPLSPSSLLASKHHHNRSSFDFPALDLGRRALFGVDMEREHAGKGGASTVERVAAALARDYSSSSSSSASASSLANQMNARSRPPPAKSDLDYADRGAYYVSSRAADRVLLDSPSPSSPMLPPLHIPSSASSSARSTPSPHSPLPPSRSPSSSSLSVTPTPRPAAKPKSTKPKSTKPKKVKTPAPPKKKPSSSSTKKTPASKPIKTPPSTRTDAIVTRAKSRGSAPPKRAPLSPSQQPKPIPRPPPPPLIGPDGLPMKRKRGRPRKHWPAPTPALPNAPTTTAPTTTDPNAPPSVSTSSAAVAVSTTTSSSLSSVPTTSSTSTSLSSDITTPTTEPLAHAVNVSVAPIPASASASDSSPSSSFSSSASVLLPAATLSSAPASENGHSTPQDGHTSSADSMVTSDSATNSQSPAAI